MKIAHKLLISIFLCILSTSAAYASSPAGKAELSDFQIFAKAWVNKLNRSHIKGIDHMEILLKPDGKYLARYHAIEPSTIKCIVKKTSSERKGLVGLLKYIETIYESTGKTPQEARDNKFNPVKNIRITEIFSNSGKGWR
ncbi:hypothetical protein [Maridesulfovibrio hydrothermalis]|uniref:Uncharacterized protein n=1 Tax=Maridesulfovibrio hydrothermalis AM13 = DSM 14728 TaxID=1121451 RepID=L0RA02_9BACT|nr:hypothetical protein [Maridesulfovibrio hydrothermalis]CCO23613.1 conserved exported protein of unknown function [Maridesulfovibrio hydrothermalis AM13 = DSM 14728]